MKAHLETSFLGYGPLIVIPDKADFWRNPTTIRDQDSSEASVCIAPDGSMWKTWIPDLRPSTSSGLVRNDSECTVTAKRHL